LNYVGTKVATPILPLIYSLRLASFR